MRAQVNVFVHPCVLDHAPHCPHAGHSSHVTCARWGACGTYAVSVGGRDRSVLVWRVVQRRTVNKHAPVVTPWVPDAGCEAGLYWQPSGEAAPCDRVQVEAGPGREVPAGPWR